MSQRNSVSPPYFPHSWAVAWGQDQYGVWEEFAYKGVVQRMRWIMPGTFLMGPSANELAQFDEQPADKHPLDYNSNSTQHAVTLTQGFWLADTACMQELWLAVMGENPSRFTDDSDLPVEGVSWDACQQFCARINAEVSGLDLMPPTEAQWEYACRAGTTTPFSFGENITTEQVNFNGNFPYKGGKKGKYRERTVPVKALPQNQWGLYQMHGNVWEWCADCYGEYPAGPVIDPDGPASGESRVLRGGGWSDVGWYVRSAIRDGFNPDYGDSGTGFRFSRGHQNG